MAKILLIETATEVCSAAIALDGVVAALAEDLQQPNHAARLTLLIEQCSQQSGIALTDLDAVAVSRGPGSYSSLRVGVSVAKGICYALDKPLIAVDTLQALAAYEMRSTEYGVQSAEYGVSRDLGSVRSAPRPRGNGEQEKSNTDTTQPQAPHSALLIPMLDARRQEVWTAVYNTQLQEVLPVQALILEHDLFYKFLQSALSKQAADMFILSGNGVKKINTESIGENMVLGKVQNCSAQGLASLAEQFFYNSDFQEVAYFEPFYMKQPNITTPNKPLF